MSMKKWVVFWTPPGREKRAKKILERLVEENGLQDKVGQILIPTLAFPRKGKISEKPLFRGYILIEMEPDPEVLDTLLSARNVRALIDREAFRATSTREFSQVLTTLSPEEVEQILQIVEQEEKKKQDEVPFLPGETVRIVEGAFEGWVGEVEEVDRERKQLRVLVEIFGRVTPITLDFTQVERYR